MASIERTNALLRDAGFANVRIEEVSSRFVVPDVDEYLSLIADTAGPIGLALRKLGTTDHAEVRRSVEEPLQAFAADGGLAVCAVAA